MNSSKTIWAIIPARGGSKTIPYKNLADLAGRPLLEYVIRAGHNCQAIQKTICSTDDSKIMELCNRHDVEIHKRPKSLSTDTAELIDVLVHLLNDYKKRQELPFAIALLMPTSPFILPEHINDCINALLSNPKARSAQTISTFTHNHHAYNQRVIKDNCVKFRFPRQRKSCNNKQKKPHFYSFGNTVVTKTNAILQGRGVFATPSISCLIPEPYALDADGPAEFELGTWYIQSGKVVLTHITE